MPPKPSDVLDQARSLIEDRIKELEDERRRLERTLADITGGRVGRRRPGRPRGSTTTRRAAGRRRGRRRSTRSDQALKHVRENPGIAASEIARKMRIKPNYVYRVMGDLQKQGKVRKQGRGYRAA
jgi:sugar-specific transcriptional regulator TrmB